MSAAVRSARGPFGALTAIAIADFRDRVRRRSFLAVLAAAGFLGLQAIQGKVEVAVGHYTGAPTSAWAGAVMALVGVTFLALAGFWVVKGSIARDEETGVGQILAATPIAGWAYTLGKAASHFLVLTAMAGVLALSAVVLQLVVPDGEAIDLFAIAAPIVLVTLPGFALVAAFAVLFETLRFLAKGFGNLVWLFFWSFLLVAAMEGPALDLFGLATMRDALGAEVKKLDPTWDGDFRIGAGGLEDRVTERFRWERLPITSALVVQRAEVVGIALLVALAAALPFDRFDPARVDDSRFVDEDFNRVWARLMGRGLVEPVDDFRFANPPSHPQLMDQLAAQIADSIFDVHQLIPTMLSSGNQSHTYLFTSKLGLA
jgi:hypothetical protein